MKIVIYLFFLVLCGCSTSPKHSNLNKSLPKASAYVEKFGQIVSAREVHYLEYVQNRLSGVLSKSSQSSKNFKTILLNTKLPIASFAGDEMILLSRGIIISLQSEAGLAFILAHEMAHEHLRHDPETGTFFQDENEDREIDADRLAVATMSAAGYDPRYSISALREVYRYAAPYIVDKNSYPSLEKREAEIANFIDSSGWEPPGTINRREFTEFRKSLR